MVSAMFQQMVYPVVRFGEEPRGESNKRAKKAKEEHVWFGAGMGLQFKSLWVCVGLSLFCGFLLAWGLGPLFLRLGHLVAPKPTQGPTGLAWDQAHWGRTSDLPDGEGT